MPTSVNSSVDTVNAAAAAIVSAESRVQPGSAQKRRWGSRWNQYWCFGPLKTNKRISHAACVPEPPATERGVPVAENPILSTSIVLPFIAPPSSPLPQSDPPTGTHTPAGLLTGNSLPTNAFSSSRQTHIYTIGPYAHETQLVSPPVFSAFTTEPSTAAVTPPSESVQLTTPSSPEVPFAQLLTSSLNRARRNSGNHKLAFSCYEVHHLISPGSANSASGTSSPYLDRRPVLEFRMVDASKLFDSKKIYTRKWGSRLGSGSVTPDGTGLAFHDSLPLENQISEVASLANMEAGSPIDEALVHHRVSFELNHEDALKCFRKPTGDVADLQQEVEKDQSPGVHDDVIHNRELCAQEASGEIIETNLREMEDYQHRRSSISLGSVKEFNFDNTDTGSPAESSLISQLWSDEKIVRDIDAEDNWSFFPLLQGGAS